MYNRYIPQPDGSYRRSRQTDVPSAAPMPPRQEPPRQEPPRRNPPPEFCPPPEPQGKPPCQKGQPSCHTRRQERPAPPPPPRQRKSPQMPQDTFGVGSFLHQLLPKDFGMEDLMVVLLLLLMSGNDEEDQNFALLTLGLYLFL